MSSALRLHEPIDVAHLSCQLVWAADTALPQFFPLWLRRRLHEAARATLPTQRFTALFEPPLPADPQTVRRYQRPAPPFVLTPLRRDVTHIDEGDVFELELLLLGSGIAFLDDFITTLQTLGRNGILQGGAGRFDVASLSSYSLSGEKLVFHRNHPAPQILDGRWWVDRPASTRCWRLQMVSPARLIAQGRPLFACGLSQLFPFAMRRVGSMLAAWCQQDVVVDPHELLAQCARITVHECSFHWHDWSRVERQGENVDLGGVIGEICFSGEGIDDLIDVLILASHLNIGRGASYGAGHFQLSALD